MPEPRRLLFIGNSFTGRNDLPGILVRLAAASPQPETLETRALLMNGMSLRAHWNRGEAVQVIQEWRPEFVVLQEQSTLPLKNPVRMHESIRLFDAEIRKAHSRTVLYMTWTRRDAAERQQELSAAYQSVGDEIGAIVVPVGLAWAFVLKNHPEMALHDADGSHPNAAGSYLAACVFYAALLQKTPVGLPSPGHGISPEAVDLLQHAAWESVCKG